MINENILNYICCPKCKGNLKRIDNVLVCQDCRVKYKIIRDIPILVDVEGLDKHYRRQILYFKKETKTKPSYILEEWQKSYIKRFKDSIPLAKNCVIADIGTGTGYMAVELAKEENTVLACDLNLEGLMRLKKISEEFDLTKNLLLFVCSAEELPIKTNLVDVFISNAVLEHLPKEEEALKEIGRICRKTAYGFVTVPLKLKYIWPFLWPLNYIHDKRIGHLRRYDLGSLRKKFFLKVVKYFYTGHLLKVLGAITFSVLHIDIFDECLEEYDKRLENKAYGASNISIIMKK